MGGSEIVQGENAAFIHSASGLRSELLRLLELLLLVLLLLRLELLLLLRLVLLLLLLLLLLELVGIATSALGSLPHSLLERVIRPLAHPRSVGLLLWRL